MLAHASSLSAQDELFTLEADDADGAGDRDALRDEDFVLRQVVVTGTRREQTLADLPMALEVIPREEIESSGAETVAEMLEERPGMQVFDAFRGQGIRLRGLEPEHTLILFDGERTIGRIDGVIDLSRWQLDEVERIEIVRGSASALWGSDALAGVVNMIPRTDTRGWSTRVRATYGYQDRRRSNRRDRFQGGPRPDADEDLPDDEYGGTYDLAARLAYDGENAGGSAFVGFHHLDDYDLDPRDGATNGPETRTYNGGGALWVKVGPARIRLRGEFLHRDDEARETRGPRVVLQRLNRTDTANVSLAPTIETRRGQLVLRASYSRFRDQFLRRVVGQAQNDPTTDTREQLGQLQLKYLHTFSDANILTIGYDTSLEALDTPRLERTGRRARLAPYVQHEWTPSEAPYVSIVPGVRFDADSWYGSQLSPKLAMRVDPHERLVLRASAGRGFRAPDFRELLLSFTDNASLGYVVYGNDDLDPERAWSVDGGFELRLDRVWIAATGFGTWVDDLITTDLIGTQGTVSEYTYVNIDRARTRGIETLARVTPLDASHAHHVRVDLGYTFLDADDRTRNRPLPGRARHVGTLHVRYRHRATGFSALWRSRLSGQRVLYDADDQRVETAPFLSLDLRVEKSFLDDRLVTFVGVDNVLNNGGTHLGTRPRTFWLGVAGRRAPDPKPPIAPSDIDLLETVIRTLLLLSLFALGCDDLGDDPLDAGADADPMLDAAVDDAPAADAGDEDAYVPDPRVMHTDLGDGVTETLVDASDTEDWIAMDLDQDGIVLDVELETNTSWDLALRRFTFRTNGGAGGPGSVRVAYEDGVDLGDVTRAPSVGWDQDEPGEVDPDIPPDVMGEDPPPTTVISHGDDPWYDYDPATHELTPKQRVYFIESSETAYFALQIIDYYDATTGDAGHPVFRWKTVEPPDGVLPGFEVDATDADAWTYLTLDGTVVTVDDESSDPWDLALRRTEIRTNGGASGPGVGGALETDFGWGALDSTSTVGFQADTLIPPPGPPGPPPVPGNEVLATWYVYNPSTHEVGVRSNANFVIRGANGDYGKLRILGWDGGLFRIEMAEIAREVDVRTATIDASDRESWVYFSFRIDAIVEPDVAASEASWDLALLRTQLGTQSGTSGEGEGGAFESDDAFDDIDVPVDDFDVDEELPLPGPPGSGTYSGNPALATWYDYDGATMTVSPRDAAFVIRTADGNFVKAQVTGWDDGTYTIRWAYAGAGRDRFGD